MTSRPAGPGSSRLCDALTKIMRGSVGIFISPTTDLAARAVAMPRE